MTDDNAVVQRLARAALRARALDLTHPPITLGEITLLPHQVAAVHWLRTRLARVGGALLADPPGLGKTFVALAVASACGARPLVIAPATLRTRWRDAAALTQIEIDFVSTERLSAPASAPVTPHALVIIDEAHHLRSATTRRHHRTAQLCATAQVLLLSATPIHNGAHDLAHLTALFHHAHHRPTTRYIRQHLTLRRTLDQIHAATSDGVTSTALPRVQHRGTISTGAHDATLTHEIRALPRLHSDAPDAHRLLTLGLVHAMRSSNAALRARCDHRIAACLAIEHAVRDHVTPTSEVRRAFASVGSDTQLAMTALLGEPATRPEPELGHSAERQRLALTALRTRPDRSGDAQRATVLRRLARWSTHPVVAFTQFTATAAAMYDHLRAECGVALLHGAGARIATGMIARQEVLDRLLAPRYRARHDAVRLLITTDVLSEGLSLSGVATIVHLDLPWTAARLDQRIGRAARIGAGVAQVTSVLLPASVSSADDHALRTLLRRKRSAMQRFVGREADDAATIHTLCALRGQGSLSSTIASAWRASCEIRSPDVSAPTVIALVRVRGRKCLVAASNGALRRPRSADWRAVQRGRVTTIAAPRGWQTPLRRLLRQWEADRELTTTLANPGGQRLAARRHADDGLVQASRAQRAAVARVVSDARRVQQQCHRPSDLASAAARMTGERTTGPSSLSQASTRPRSDVTVLLGIVLIPE